MNRTTRTLRTLVHAVALSGAMSLSLGVLAQEATLFEDEPVSLKSRAEVRQEVMAALARGERLSWGEADPRALQAMGGSTRTRAAVRAEVLAAIAAGERLSWGEANPNPHRIDVQRDHRLAKAGAQVPR